MMTKTLRGNRNFYWMLLATLAVVAALMVMAAARSAHASTTFTVNSTSDNVDLYPGDGVCGTGAILKTPGTQECTLRAAIQEANEMPGEDIIDFNIPGTGVHTIQVNSGGQGPLPDVTASVTINGYSQPDASPTPSPEVQTRSSRSSSTDHRTSEDPD